MWYRGANLISQGNQVVEKGSRYIVDNEFSLIIKNVIFDDSDTYFCQILPEKLKQNVSLKVVSEEEIMKGRY